MKRNESNGVAIDASTKETEFEWLSIKDMLGLPGMPTTPQGCNSMMKNRLEERGNVELKRKVSGTKAFLYHFSLLPWEAMDYWAMKHDLKIGFLDEQQLIDAVGFTEKSNIPIPEETKKIRSSLARLNSKAVKYLNDGSEPERNAEQLMSSLYKSLPSDDDRKVFLSKMLEFAAERFKLSSEESKPKEILRQDLPNANEPSASKLSTHGKKAG